MRAEPNDYRDNDRCDFWSGLDPNDYRELFGRIDNFYTRYDVMLSAFCTDSSY